MLRALEESWTSTLLDEYLDYCDYMARPRPRFSLPYSARTIPLSESDEAVLRWNVPRDVTPILVGESLLLRANGNEWIFDPEARCVLDLLRNREAHSISTLHTKTKNHVTLKQLIELLNALVEHGLIRIEAFA